MADINKSIFTGRIGNDPELKQTPDGKAVCNLRLAVTRPKAKGAETAETDWFDIVAWNGMAEACATHLTKGSFIVVTAAARTRTWKDSQGNKRFNIDFIADEIKFLSMKKQSASNALSSSHNLTELAQDEELPF